MADILKILKGGTVVFYYQHTLDTLETKLREKFPDIQANESDEVELGGIASPDYLLWMIGKIREMDTRNARESTKAARWLGWVLAHSELLLPMGNNESRRLIQEDLSRGLDQFAQVC